MSKVLKSLIKGLVNLTSPDLRLEPKRGQVKYCHYEAFTDAD